MNKKTNYLAKPTYSTVVFLDFDIAMRNLYHGNDKKRQYGSKMRTSFQRLAAALVVALTLSQQIAVAWINNNALTRGRHHHRRSQETPHHYVLLPLRQPLQSLAPPRFSFLKRVQAKESKDDDMGDDDFGEPPDDVNWEDEAVLEDDGEEVEGEEEEDAENVVLTDVDELLDEEDGDDVDGDDDDMEYDVFEDDDDDDDSDEDSEEGGILDEDDILATQTLSPTDVLSEEDEIGGDEYDVDADKNIGLAEEWEEEDEDEEVDYPLEDDPDDPNYQIQKELVEQAAQAAERRRADQNFDALDFIRNQMTSEMAHELEDLPLIKETEERTKDMMLTEADVQDLDIETEVARVSDLMDDDPYPRHGPGETNLLEKGNGLTDDDMEEVDSTWKSIRRRTKETPWDKVMRREEKGFGGLSNETLDEMEACLEEIGGSAYNSTRWLLYDLDFNVTNLMLAAIKHNRDAPILFQHWYPQLLTYSRYESAQARNFDFTWEDVENADVTELENYYAGMGYAEIPAKAPAETGIIEFDYLDEEELKMAAFQDWVTEVYNPEWDRKDFDDDEWRDEDNVFSHFYEPPQHPDLPTFEDAHDDIANWIEDTGTDEELAEKPEGKAYRDFMARDIEYQVVEDEEFEREFRGHLVVACTGNDADLEIAEKITATMGEEFGKQIYVETRVIGHAREEDNVFEIWLESYEIDLLHSKKRATSNTKDWDGPAECDDNQIAYLVDRVGFLISDEARYSYRMEMEVEA